MNPLLIRASAGTGKTYRLSLEFINLLLKYRTDFVEILVITFTKKATAEIRERIFEQLKEIVEKTEIGMELMNNMQLHINPELRFDQEEMTFLQKTYKSMLTNKSAVHISTIDSFVNTIFSGIIAPFHNVIEFQIDNKINDEILPEIFEYILKEDKLQIYQDIFLKAKRRNLETFHKFITDIIENRWLFEFIDLSDFDENKIKEKSVNSWKNYDEHLRSFLMLLQTEITNYNKPVAISDLMQKDFIESISNVWNSLQVKDFASTLFDILTNESYINEHFKLLLDKNIWNGGRLRNPDLKDFYAEVQSNLADYFYYEKALDEQWKIISLAGEILQKYDEIKFRDRIFTHSDISYYTFRFLYDPQISVVDKQNVLNLFYEQLSFNTRFVLIDEFQDTSILQWSIFQPMLKEISSGIGQKDYGGIIVVGDEKQAIYGWRGGERKLLTDFAKILNEPVEYDSLTTSYRSKPILMNWLNRLFGSAHLNFIPDWDYTEIDCNKKDGGYVQVDLRNSNIDGNKLEKSEIYQEFVDNILLPNLQDETINPADTAILMRKNSELIEMATILDENSISYTFETSGSLFSHHAVKTILFVLKFMVYEDIYELIKFLRSDLILMKPSELKEVIRIYHDSENIDDFLLECNLHHCFSNLYDLRNQQQSLLNIIKKILESFGFSSVFNTEIELKNLQRFLEVVTEFERSNHEYTNDISGFLQYCHALSEKEEYSQIGQSVSDSIKLMTIHKSKGLQFETVFAVFDVMGRSGSNNSGLSLYYKFNDDCRSLQDFAFTANYDKIVKMSAKKVLVEYVENRDTGDELNNIYVALTRAKNNLFLYLHFDKKGGLEKLIKDVKNEDSVLKNLTKTICQEFAEILQNTSENNFQIQVGEISKDEKNIQIRSSEELELPDFFKFNDWQNVAEKDIPNLEKIKTEFLQNISILIGNIVHGYLSHIRYDDADELALAKSKTISKFGSLLPKNQLDEIIQKVENFINSNSEFFDKNIWDKVFNEFTIFDAEEREFRIDRMMIDTKNKLIKIIDFKTGSIYEEEQLDRYREIIEKFSMVKREKYRVETEYVKIDI
ncbi:MAG: UvrD-helicase domain-containing protein [Candidatus Cloacimonetes bacterium]|nr:UvrD-helicase domain-containing protein [Candidatus Cloacimonadota bacterium]MCF7813925.1 UvrD-helicase domain-containing protein [Candidatus Cloacimonadota bacterium]MCF7868522.1 UvrD-helicase domain-containing protein [Candidatus Cloacimonadota bacterium]MCF7884037.1 UvrD-helicase domain-containing protein [Candidatus Cloacimonadota bacterium]